MVVGRRDRAARSWRSGQLGEEVVPLVVDDDERREVLDVDTKDRLHPQLLVFDDFDLLYGLEREDRRRPSDRAEVEPAVLLAGVRHLARAGSFGESDVASPVL